MRQRLRDRIDQRVDLVVSHPDRRGGRRLVRVRLGLGLGLGLELGLGLGLRIAVQAAACAAEVAACAVP